VDGAEVIPERLASNLGDRARQFYARESNVFVVRGQGDLRRLLIADM